MARRKYPDEFNTLINFETGESEMVLETKEARQARLRRAAARRNRARFRESDWIREARWTAVTEAWRRVYEGGTLPIHFDLVLIRDGRVRTERYTLADAAFTSRLDKDGEIVGSKGGNRIKLKRPAAVPADFVHREAFSQSVEKSLGRENPKLFQPGAEHSDVCEGRAAESDLATNAV